MKTFAELKRDLTVGTKLQLIWADRPDHKYLDTTRAIIKQQTNAVKLDGGSWLGLGSTGEKAENFTYDGECFTVNMNGKDILTYKIMKGQN